MKTGSKGKTLGEREATMGRAESKKKGKGSREKETEERTEEASGEQKGMEESRRGRDIEKRERIPKRSGSSY